MTRTTIHITIAFFAWLINANIIAQNACGVEGIVIEASSFEYAPSFLQIEPGETLVWINLGGTHDANGEINSITGLPFNNPEPFDFPSIPGSPGGTCIGSFTFTVPGIYNYDCSVGSHAQNGMVASFQVGSAGCIDPLASNYDPNADFDDGSCQFTGCTDPSACNYDPSAQTDDGSCTYPGCTNVTACNYNSASGCDDGSCLFPGCTNEIACNYDSSAGCDDGSCSLPGCTDQNAANFQSEAGCDDGSCLYYATCTGDLNYDSVINVSDLLIFLTAFGNICQ
jgi:plastocyanin